ncbi:uncharacterized protein LOC108921662 [Scleropages formosus]|uniref:uncharacterized protein LOC108921662 n=1 Tax=Scleropages formosus TaxID=113540 RepID=UPI0008787455|nr:uncharacterized protein LOC108921662 [Scleropages formosus]XP_029114096.1 uncharacterized protein LOC108921662 [Scleropages formosus]
MGSVSSRWKRVAPASPAQDPPALCGSFGVQSVSGHSRSRSAGGLDRHSEGLDSQSSADGEEDLSAELDRILAEYQVLESSDSAQRRAALPRDGFGSSSGRDDGRDLKWTPLSQRSEVTQKPASSGDSESGRVREEEDDEGEEDDEEEDCSSGTRRLSKRAPHRVPEPCANDMKGLQDLACTRKTDSVPGSCGDSLVTMPVIQYDKSEEDLMETIEREFS